jgi:hypothetical protein
MIIQHCDTRNNQESISSGPYLFVRFLADGKSQRQGFSATYEFLSQEEIKERTLRKFNNIYPTSGSDQGKFDFLIDIVLSESPQSSHSAFGSRSLYGWHRTQKFQSVSVTNVCLLNPRNFKVVFLLNLTFCPSDDR